MTIKKNISFRMEEEILERKRRQKKKKNHKRNHMDLKDRRKRG